MAIAAAATPASTPASTPAAAPAERTAELTAEDANLYIFRQHAEPTAWSPTVKVDGSKIAALEQRSYTAIRVSPGAHTIRLVWPLLSSQKADKVEITIEKDRYYYFEITGVSRMVGIRRYRMGSSLAEIVPADGASRVRGCCKFKPPLAPGP